MNNFYNDNKIESRCNLFSSLNITTIGVFNRYAGFYLKLLLKIKLFYPFINVSHFGESYVLFETFKRSISSPDTLSYCEQNFPY